MRSQWIATTVLSCSLAAGLAATASAGAPQTVDARIGIPLSAADAAELRTEMRGQLMTVQGLVAALAADDWDAVAALADAQRPGPQRHAAGPPGFRAHLPATWFELARPMHQAYGAIAGEARGERRRDAALRHLSSAMSQCTACHALHRIEEGVEAPTAD